MDVAQYIIFLAAQLKTNSIIPGEARTQQLVMLAIGAVGLGFLWIASRRKTKQTVLKNSNTSRGATAADSDGVVKDIQSAMTGLEQLSRRIHAQLDAKISKLESTIRAADDRINHLARATRHTSDRPTLDVTVGEDDVRASLYATPTGGPSSGPSPSDSPHDAIYRLADSGASVLAIAREAGRPRGEVELILSLRKTAEENDYFKAAIAAKA